MAAVAEPGVMQRTTMGIQRMTGYDVWLLSSALLLSSVGVLMVYSASIGQAYTLHVLFHASSTFYLQREVMSVLVGLVALIVGATIDYRRWRRWSKLLAAGSLLLLLAVLVPHVGTTSNGAQRWFSLAGFSIQPSEIVKLTLAIYMAHWLSTRADRIGDFKFSSMPFGIMLGGICILIMLQPDMGTAIVIGVSMIALYFIAGASIKHLMLGLVSAFAIAYVFIRFKEYQTQRIQAWLDPNKYPTGAGYHILHSIWALGSGGLFGVGLGNSVQKYYVPAPFTDSIFAVTGEELGFVGSMFIIGLFVLLAQRGFKVSRRAPDDFGRLLAIGITTVIVTQALLNIAVVTDTLPFTGVPLPFISFGGSSLVVSMLGVGILLNISRQNSHLADPKAAPETRGQRPSKYESRSNRWKDWRPRLPRPRGRRRPDSVLASSIRPASRRDGSRSGASWAEYNG